MKEHYQKLISLIEEALESKQKIDLSVILEEAVAFFESLRTEYQKADSSERAEMLDMIEGLQKRIQQITSELAKRSGLSEEQLYLLSENPSQFTPEQWNQIQETKHKLHDSARKFRADLMPKKDITPSKSVRSDKKIPPPIRRIKRQKWLKS